MKYSTRSCEICGSKNNILLYHQDFSKFSDNSSLLSSYDVVVCSNCGFCYSDHIPNQRVFDTYYREMSKYEHGGVDSIYDKRRFEIAAAEIIPYIPSPNSKILEIGCANGQVLGLLKKSGYQLVFGIDPSPSSAKLATEIYGVHVTANTLNDMEIEKGSIDFVILLGVLEHLREITKSFHIIRDLLSIEGRILIAVPDASRYPEGEDAPYQEFSVEHINFFSPCSLTNLLRKNGFSEIATHQVMIETNYRTTTPVLFGVYTKSTFPGQEPLQHDVITRPNLEKYISNSAKVDQLIREKISSLVVKGNPILVWGTGAHTLRLLATSKLSQVKIEAFIDSNIRYQSKKINGIKVISPGDVSKYKLPILISSRVYQHEIQQQIQTELMLSNEVITLYEEIIQ